MGFSIKKYAAGGQAAELAGRFSAAHAWMRYQPPHKMRRWLLATLFSLVGMLTIAPTVTHAQQPAWQLLQASSQSGHALAYDQARQVTVRFGGTIGNTAAGNAALTGETDEWNGVAWNRRATTGPSPRLGHAMAYDHARGVTVLFGGYAGTVNGETWEWNGSSWTQRVVAGPSPRYAHAMAYDSVRGVTVLFGGCNSGDSRCFLGDTWEWNGAAWTLRPASGPVMRYGHAMAFDEARGVTVLFGGYALNLGSFTGGGDDAGTWEWNGSQWTQRLVNGPLGRSFHAMAYDTIRGVTVLFGGSGGRIDTWEWNGVTWLQRSTIGPASGAMVFDATNGVCVLFGYSDASGETWQWNGTEWNRRAINGPAARQQHAMVYDSARGVSVLFGGLTPNSVSDTWEWNGAAWSLRTNAGPTARSGHAMAYDQQRGVTVLFGGSTSDGVSSETWEWNGMAWALRSNAGPTARSSHAMAYDQQRGVTVLFGGSNSDGVSSETWEWNGSTWTQRVVAGPSPRHENAMVYDLVRGVTVLFGGQTQTGLDHATWEWNGAAWSLRAVSGPPPLQLHAMAYDTARNVTVLFGGYSNNGSTGETWEWNGTGWTQVLGSGPTPRYAHAMAFDQARGVTLVFGGTGSSFGSETWGLRVPCTEAAITSQPSPASACPGDTVGLAVTATSTSPISYQWRKAGVNIAGGSNPSALSATLMLTGVASTDATWYDCLITSSTCTIVSSPASLTIREPAQHPIASPNQAVCLGAATSISISIPNLPSVGPVTYSWTRNGQLLPETGPSILISASAMSDAGTYICTVTGPCNIVSSEPILVSVLVAPTIAEQPQSQSVCRTFGAVFSVSATGNGSLSYQWRKGGLPISAAVNSSAVTNTLYLPNVQATDGGTYDCIVTDSCRSVTTQTATLATRYCVCVLADIAGGGPDGREGDGTIDGSDFIAFMNSFAIGDATVDPAADVAGGGLVGLDPDGTIDGTDFIVFINVFSAGC